MNSNRWFFLLAVPVGWAAMSLLHFHFPGDEYGLWAVSSMAGTWSLFILPNVGDIHQPWIRLCVAGVGALVMAGTGWVLWRLGVRKRLWVPVWLAASAILLFWALQSYPNLERALAKNGSWTAYILSSLLLGMYAATVISAIVTPSIRLKFSTRPGGKDLPAANEASAK
jgi:hypothetical protein